MSEKILVVPRQICNEFGLCKEYNEDLLFLSDSSFYNSFTFMDRGEAEVNEDFKQIIPYCVITYQDELDNYREKVLVYERGKKGSENRLHSKLSLGVGGHTEMIDSTGNSRQMLDDCIRREIKEELGIDYSGPVSYAASMYDASNAVGRVHLGLVVKIRLSKELAMEFEEGVLVNPEWQDYSLLLKNKDRFENWSKLVIENLLRL
jgi:predicted NUDIX family phosphoesterase